MRTSDDDDEIFLGLYVAGFILYSDGKYLELSFPVGNLGN